MIGQHVVLVLHADDDPLWVGERTRLRSGDRGFVVDKHPRWDAWRVWIEGVREIVTLFPDEMKEAQK